MKLISYLIVLILFIPITWAQTSGTIISGRPGQSIGAEVVGTKMFQVQSGVTFNEVKSATSEEDWVNDNAIRYGINESLELSTVFNYKVQKSVGSGVDNLMLGGRYNLIAQPDGLIPALAFQTRLRLKGEGDFKRDKVRPESILSSVHDLGRWGSINLNFIFSYDGNIGHPIYGYIVNWSLSLTDRWGIFVEEYASHQGNDWSHAWDTGAAYLVNKDLQLDFSFGYDLDSDFNSSFYSFGVSWRNSLI